MEYHTKFAISKVHDLSDEEVKSLSLKSTIEIDEGESCSLENYKINFQTTKSSLRSYQERRKADQAKAVKLKQEKTLKFHVITQSLTDMEGYWDQSNGHAQAPHPVKFERWEWAN